MPAPVTARRFFSLVALALPAQAQVPGTPDGEDFGRALASGDFNADGADDLAIGYSEEEVGSVNNAGAVTVVYGSAANEAAFAQRWTRDSPGVDGDPRVFDRFGEALATGDFDGDGFDDLAAVWARAGSRLGCTSSASSPARPSRRSGST
jgi:hypothetical protein